MLAVWSWLRELLELEREVSPEEAAKALTGAGLEVEEFRRVGDDFSGVIVAEVVSKAKHPQADKLTLVKVRGEEGRSPIEVICGAPNVPDAGGRVLWARPGARLPGGLEIGAKKLKGIESAGMLCSGQELGISDDSEGIVVLGAEGAQIPVGAEAAEALALRDVVFDLSIPANRPDALGHLGLARELAALLGGRARLPETKLENREAGDGAPLRVIVDDPGLCPRYVARVLRGLTVGPSPLWMQQRLRNVGVRPISNLVDVTNYVMFELGQPLHAFDGDKLPSHSIRVRRAEEGESLVTLDEQERILQSSDLLITDGERPIALAGVMGGLDTEVGDHTKTLVLESAAFEPSAIRRSARRLGLHSEASHRFERGVDPNGAAIAADRAAKLMAELAGGVVVGPAVDVYPAPLPPRQVEMRLSRCAALSGIDFDAEEVQTVLTRQGLEVEEVRGDILSVRVPTARGDVVREVDLIEEVVRMHGFDKVPATLPVASMAPARSRDHRVTIAHEAMVGAGFCEAITYGFTSPGRLNNLGLGDGDLRARPISVTNPMTREHALMRPSLWPNLLAAVAHNLKRDVLDVALYELGHSFLETGKALPTESLELCAVLSGRRDDWLGAGPPCDFFDIKGAAWRVLETLYGAASGVELLPQSDAPYLHPGVAADLKLDGKKIGEIGEIHPRVRERFELTQPIFGFCLALGDMPPARSRQMEPIPRFPAITRDVSLLLDSAIAAAQIVEIITKNSPSHLVSATVLEDYRDPAHVPVGKKGMLWSITYRSSDRTLTDAEVDAVHGPLEEELLRELSATRR